MRCCSLRGEERKTQKRKERKLERRGSNEEEGKRKMKRRNGNALRVFSVHISGSERLVGVLIVNGRLQLKASHQRLRQHQSLRHPVSFLYCIVPTVSDSFRHREKKENEAQDEMQSNAHHRLAQRQADRSADSSLPSLVPFAAGNRDAGQTVCNVATTINTHTQSASRRRKEKERSRRSRRTSLPFL